MVFRLAEFFPPDWIFLIQAPPGLLAGGFIFASRFSAAPADFSARVASAPHHRGVSAGRLVLNTFQQSFAFLLGSLGSTLSLKTLRFWFRKGIKSEAESRGKSFSLARGCAVIAAAMKTRSRRPRKALSACTLGGVIFTRFFSMPNTRSICCRVYQTGRISPVFSRLDDARTKLPWA